MAPLSSCCSVTVWPRFRASSLVFSSPVDQKVIAVGLPTMLIRGDVFFWGALMAAALLVSIPTAIAFYFVLDRFVASLTGGADA